MAHCVLDYSDTHASSLVGHQPSASQSTQPLRRRVEQSRSDRDEARPISALQALLLPSLTVQEPR